jgi:hypothetical protein
MTGKEEWYSNKDIFEMVQALRDELQETRNAVRKYNNLVGRLAELENWRIEVESRYLEREQIKGQFLRWGGWIIAALSLAFTALRGSDGV